MMDRAHLPLSEYPGIPGIHRPSQDHPGMDRAHPSPPFPHICILGFPGYFDQNYPGMDSPPTHPCLSILGFPGYFDHPRIILGWTELTPPPPIWVSWDSRDTSTIPGSSWDGHSSLPLSEYPGILRTLRPPQHHPRMDTVHAFPLSEYLGIPETLGHIKIIPGWMLLTPL